MGEDAEGKVEGRRAEAPRTSARWGGTREGRENSFILYSVPASQGQVSLMSQAARGVVFSPAKSVGKDPPQLTGPKLSAPNYSDL